MPNNNNNKPNFAISHSGTVRLLPAIHQERNLKDPKTILAGTLMPARVVCVAALAVPFL
jgi:hypothetical protein